MSQAQPAPEWDTDKVLTVPNLISFVRLLGVPVFGWLIIAGHDVWAVGMLALFGATDWLDGWLARKLKQRSPLGIRLDPAADRLYILMAIIALVVRGILPWWMLVVLLARDVMLLMLVPPIRRATGKLALPVLRTGKAATMFLLMAFPLVLIGSAKSLGIQAAFWVGWTFAVAGAVLYWTSGIMYLRRTVEMARERREAIDGSP
ncbi:CDP-alcohol phosphatidyltransferase family protein [Tessaracoccus rhinocerotis]|uniref:CDP-alcohol phosphatidyltransferase family protein n=1 Tax=Tessaracoccus rhinocerotis TaxID=1689449 RepID=A0A553JXS7_9ACTN|nr:CDP-alcohol phosphatidyltransferase family protein [Tessaracoccus rhinocerotis]TRY17240.1 CDP-alcohol phosphatidyltransferase family protein [Tessaracoccus rhinocerotis]